MLGRSASPLAALFPRLASTAECGRELIECSKEASHKLILTVCLQRSPYANRHTDLRNRHLTGKDGSSLARDQMSASIGCGHMSAMNAPGMGTRRQPHSGCPLDQWQNNPYFASPAITRRPTQSAVFSRNVASQTASQTVREGRCLGRRAE